MNNKGKIYTVALYVILTVAVTLLIIQNASGFTGFATEGSTYSNVSIQKYLAINFGSDLANGIYFGSVATLPATDVNATHNYDGANNATNYYLVVSNDSNSQVDFCIKANTGLTSPALDVIGLGNETYATNYTNSNLTTPPLSDQIPMNITYRKAATQVGVGQTSYWRFWLDIPAGQASGDYNNTVSFKGVTFGNTC